MYKSLEPEHAPARAANTCILLHRPLEPEHALARASPRRARPATTPCPAVEFAGIRRKVRGLFARTGPRPMRPTPAQSHGGRPLCLRLLAEAYGGAGGLVSVQMFKY